MGSATQPAAPREKQGLEIQMSFVTGNSITQLMQSNKITISALAARMGVTQKRVREVRAFGVNSYLIYCDWHQAITGINIYKGGSNA